METVKAAVTEVDNMHFIRIENDGKRINIPLSEDKPNEVKGAFNELLVWVKESEIEIEMDEVGTDLFSQVAKEYISQLNREIQEVRHEMERLGLVTDGD